MNLRIIAIQLIFILIAGFQSSGQPREIYIEGYDQMKFSVETIKAKPGETLKIRLKTISSRKKSEMAHNWVLLKKRTDALSFVTKGMRHKSNDYIDPSLENKIIAATDLLGGGEEDAITFKVPNEKGTYEYICTFPAHYQSGMKGKLIVE